MERAKVKDLMIPLDSYATVDQDATLFDVVLELEKSRERQQDPCQHPHRAVLVLDAQKQVLGKVGLIDVLRGLEPKYQEIGVIDSTTRFGFTPEFMKTMMTNFGLWQDPLDNICRKAAAILVKTIMHTPASGEFVDEGASLGEAAHQLVVGHHQSLLVISGKKVVGVLRLSDVYDQISQLIKACALQPNPSGPSTAPPKSGQESHDMPDQDFLGKNKVNWSRLVFMFLGAALFVIVYYSPSWPDAIDPAGKHFVLSREGKGALAVFLMAGIWWVFEVVPIGVTSILIGVLQAMFLIRPAANAFKDFMDPSVLFIFASVVIGTVFTKTGLTRRLAYKMLAIVGEKTSMIYLGCFVVIALLTLIMAHTAVAATMFPLLLAIYSLYGENEKPTRFGKGLFMGMAYVAGASSIVTLLGSARAAVGISFFKQFTGREISFFELSYYMLPVGWLMVLLLWGYFMIFLRPEKKAIPGLRERAKSLYADLGRVTRREWLAAIIVLGIIAVLSLRSFIPALKPLDKTAIILISTILFFVTGILEISDLETIPWNIILLFGGAMSIGFCLWDTGAAQWLAINWLALFQNSGWFIFVLSMSFFVMVMTNFIMNVAAIAISLPVALVIAPYLHVAPEVVFFSALVTAGMPFLLLVGAAPNAIAYESRQFTSGQFFGYGLLASVLLMIVLAISILVIWPILGMPVTLPH